MLVARWAGHRRFLWGETADACGPGSRRSGHRLPGGQLRVRLTRVNRPCTYNCKRRTGVFQPSVLHEGVDTPGRGRWGVTVTSGSGILLRFKHAFNDNVAILLTLSDQKEMLLDDRVLVEL